MARRRIIFAMFAAIVMAYSAISAASASMHAKQQVYLPLIVSAAPQPEAEWYGCLVEWWLCGPAE